MPSCHDGDACSHHICQMWCECVCARAFYHGTDVRIAFYAGLGFVLAPSSHVFGFPFCVKKVLALTLPEIQVLPNIRLKQKIAPPPPQAHTHTHTHTRTHTHAHTRTYTQTDTHTHTHTPQPYTLKVPNPPKHQTLNPKTRRP